MARYPPLVAGSLLWLSTLTGISVSQSTWMLDPQKHLALMFNHMSVKVNSTIYTIGGAAIYWTPNSTASSMAADNNGSVFILKTANSFLRALDLSKPVDFEAEFSDTSEVISELPFAIPHVKRGALWADQDIIYYWGGELEFESVYMDGAFQNRTREWPDPMKYYTYDLNQSRGSGTWKTISIPAGGSDTLTYPPSYGEYAYSTEARKGFYHGGLMARWQLKNKDGSNATSDGTVFYYSNSMVAFDPVTNVWKNETVIAELTDTRDGVMVYVEGVGEKGILVRMGGTNKKGFVGVPSTLSYIFIFVSELVGFDTVHVYDIAANIWYRQPTTSKTNIFPENRRGVFCAGSVAAADKTSFTIYIYGGHDDEYNYKKGTWALTMPYFQWLPVGSTGEPGGRSETTCETVGGQLAMVRGHGNSINRGDRNGGSYFYDMTNHTWSLTYKPSQYKVPKAIYDVIGGNGQGRATVTGPTDQENFAVGLGKLFEAARRTGPPGQDRYSPSPTNSASSNSASGRGPSPTSAIVGGVIGGVALFSAIGAGIWALLRLRRGSTGTVGERDTMDGFQENPVSPNDGGNSPWRHGIYSGPLPELDNRRV
ncbi:hypothetical protein HOY80DRAFT_1133192 [Tuber brumale]|nr:hypothetical protein HOY80DRAFT_1133192 [Tuber brumale]